MILHICIAKILLNNFYARLFNIVYCNRMGYWLFGVMTVILNWYPILDPYYYFINDKYYIIFLTDHIALTSTKLHAFNQHRFLSLRSTLEPITKMICSFNVMWISESELVCKYSMEARFETTIFSVGRKAIEFSLSQHQKEYRLSKGYLHFMANPICTSTM